MELSVVEAIRANNATALENALANVPFATVGDDPELVLMALDSPECMRVFAHRAAIEISAATMEIAAQNPGLFKVCSNIQNNIHFATMLERVYGGYLKLALSISSRYPVVDVLLEEIQWSQSILFSVAYDFVVIQKPGPLQYLRQKGVLATDTWQQLKIYAGSSRSMNELIDSAITGAA